MVALNDLFSHQVHAGLHAVLASFRMKGKVLQFCDWCLFFEDMSLHPNTHLMLLQVDPRGVVVILFPMFQGCDS